MVVQVVLDSSSSTHPLLLLLHNFKFPHCHFFFKNIPVSCYMSCRTRLLPQPGSLVFFFNLSRFKRDKMWTAVCFRGSAWVRGCRLHSGETSLYLPFSHLIRLLPVLNGMFRKHALLGAEGCALVPDWLSSCGKELRPSIFGKSAGTQSKPAVSASPAGARLDPEDSDDGTVSVTVHLLCSLGLHSPKSHMYAGEQWSTCKWLFPPGDLKDCVFVTLWSGVQFSLLSRENCCAKSFCNFLKGKLLGRDKLSFNIFQMHLHWLWGKDGRKRIAVMVSSTKSKTEKLLVWCDNIQRLT